MKFLHQTSAPSTPSVSTTEKYLTEISSAALYTGIYTRVARRLGADPSHVRRVALRQRKSQRVEHALAAEIALINQQTVLSGNGERAQETRPCETKAQPATASPDNAGCGANGQVSKPRPERHAVSPSSSRPRVRLGCVLVCNNGDVYARVGGSFIVTKIGRNDALAKNCSPSRHIYPRGPLVPIQLYREAVS